MYPLYLADEGKQYIIRKGGEGHLGRSLPRTRPKVAVHPQVWQVCYHPGITDGQVVFQAVLKAGAEEGGLDTFFLMYHKHKI